MQTRPEPTPCDLCGQPGAVMPFTSPQRHGVRCVDRTACNERRILAVLAAGPFDPTGDEAPRRFERYVYE